MSQLDFHLYIERRDEARNMARFYALSLEETLLGPAVCRRFGRIGTRGREIIEHAGTEREALARFLAIAARKRRRGYRVPLAAEAC